MIGGLALSMLCFLFAQTGSRRNRIGNPTTSMKYGPPDQSEFYDHSSNGRPPSTTEPYFRIVISKKANLTSNSTSKPTSASASTSTTETSEYYNDVYSDDYDNDTDYSRNLALFQNLNETELRRFFSPDLNVTTASSKTALDTTTAVTTQYSASITPMVTSLKSLTTLAQNATHQVQYLYENTTEIKSTSMPSSTLSLAEFEGASSSTPSNTKLAEPYSMSSPSTIHQTPSNAAFQFSTSSVPTTLLLDKTTISSTLKSKDHGRETVTEIFQVDSAQNISPKTPTTTFSYEYISQFVKPEEQSLTESTTARLEPSLLLSTTPRGRSETSVTEAFNQSGNQFFVQPKISDADLRYLPPPSASLSVPEAESSTDHQNANQDELQRISVTPPSRLYLPPNQI